MGKYYKMVISSEATLLITNIFTGFFVMMFVMLSLISIDNNDNVYPNRTKFPLKIDGKKYIIQIERQP